jgi:hypothetical protein
VVTSGMSVEPAWSVKCSVAREGRRCPAGAHGVTAPQDFVIHRWDNLVSNFVLVRNGFPRLRIERKLALFIAVTLATEIAAVCGLLHSGLTAIAESLFFFTGCSVSTKQAHQARVADLKSLARLSVPLDQLALPRQPRTAVAYPGIFFGGVQQIQLRTEGRENGDLGAVVP